MRHFNFGISYGKAWHHRAEGNYLYLCVWAKLCILFIFFKRSSAIEHVLDWNVRQALKNLYTTGTVSYKDSCCLVHFSSNISCVHTQRLSLLGLDENKQSLLPGTIEVNSEKMLLLSMSSFRHSCECNAWQSEWGFTPRMITMNCNSVLNESWERNETALCMAEQQTWGFEDYRQAEKLLFLRCICT
jgi:hypothetical protein